MNTQTDLLPQQIIQKMVREKIDDLLTEQIDYEWGNSDFTNELNSYTDLTLVQTTRSVTLNESFYESFLKHLTEVVSSGIMVLVEKDTN
jgi:hypothetical protein